MPALPDGYTIALATPDQIGSVAAIERGAATLFRGWDVSEHVIAQTTPDPELRRAQAAGLLWVALERRGSPVGYAYARVSSGHLYLEELDVHPDHGRRGLGTALVRAVEQAAALRGCSDMRLTTFRDIPWNAPFYERIGFSIVSPPDLDDDLRERLAEEAGRGLDPARRVAMRRVVPGRTAMR